MPDPMTRDASAGSGTYARLRAALDTMLDPYVVLDAVRDGDGRIVDFVFTEANAAACAFNGMPREQLLGTRLLDLHPAAATSGLLDDYREVVETGRPLVLDDWAYPQDLLAGTKRRYDVRAVRVGDGLGQTWRDVTARFEHGQELLASEHVHRLLAENAGDVVFHTRNGVAVWISAAIREVLGWEREDLVGTDLTELVHPDDRGAIEAARRTLLPGQISSLRYRVRTRRGPWRWVQVNTRLLVDDDGVVTGTIGSLRDVDAEVGALAALEQSREQLRGTVEAMLDPWVLLRAVRDDTGRIVDFRYVDVNEAACRSNGMDRVSLVGSLVGDLFPELRESGVLADYARVVETGEPLVKDDFAFASERTGWSGYHDTRGVRVGDGISLTWRDVTQRHRDVTDLAESRHMYRLLAENATDVVFRADPEGVLDWVSPSATALLDWAPDELVGRSFMDLSHPDDRAIAMAVHDRLGGTSDETFEIRLQRRDSGFRWLSVHARSVVEDGIEVARVGGLRDIQAEVEARQALAESEERLRLAMANSAIGMCLVAPDGTFQSVNPALCALLGRSEAVLTASTWQELTHPEDLDADLALVTDVLHGRIDSYRLQKRFLRPDGQVVWGDLSVACVRNPDRSVRYFVSQIIDTTETVLARAALAESEATYRLLAENATSIVSRTSNAGVTEWISPSVRGALGWTPDQVVGRPIAEFVHPDDLPAVRQAQQRALAGQEAGFRMRARTADGDYRWFAILLRPTRDEQGRVTGRVAGWRDVQSEVEAADALAASEEHYRLLAQNSSDVVFRDGLDGRIEWVSPAVAEVLGWDPDDLVGETVPGLLHPSDVGRAPQVQAEVDAEGRGGFEARMRRVDGTYVWMSIVGRSLTDDAGTVVGRVASARDIHAEHQARADLTRSEERFRTAMQSSAVGMATLDLGRRFTEVNPVLADILGVDQDWLLTRTLSDVLHPDDDRTDLDLRYRVQSGALRNAVHEVRIQRPGGGTVWVEHSIGSVHDTDGTPTGYVSQFVDVTDARAARELLRQQATRDPLTNLVNRRGLIAEVERLLSYSPRTGTRVAILFIDLDRLKPINDAHGHAVGDAVIVTVAERIKAAVRTDDVVARFGGDEYVAVLPTIHTVSDAEHVAAKIHRSVAEPIRTGGVEIRATLSIGLTVAEPGDDPAQSLHRADAALYRAKRDGRNQTATYDPDLDEDAGA